MIMEIKYFYKDRIKKRNNTLIINIILKQNLYLLKNRIIKSLR